jgi:hypothetical protein
MSNNRTVHKRGLIPPIPILGNLELQETIWVAAKLSPLQQIVEILVKASLELET